MARLHGASARARFAPLGRPAGYSGGLPGVGSYRGAIRGLAISVATAAALLGAAAGSAQASLASDPAPYMGWNPYYADLGGSDESTFESVAQSLISTGLQKAGYRVFWLDFGWASGARDSSGQLTVSPTQWPTGMSGFTSWLHHHGFYAGIYTDAGLSGCSGEGVGSYGHYQQDANTFAAWGFDAVKVDFCGAGQQIADGQINAAPQQLYTEFSQAIAGNASNRPMLLNVCNFWRPGAINGTLPTLANSVFDNYQWAPGIAQSWRTDTDIGFVGDIQFQWVLRNLNSDAAQPSAAGPPSATIPWGHWNDPDYLGPQLGMTATQAQSQFSMWAMLGAPLMLGSDPRTLSASTISMLTNPRVIAVDRDSLGAQGTLLSQTSTGQQVWVKPLASGSRAVALLNTGTSAAQISTTATAIGLPSASEYKLWDLWANTHSTTTGTISATVQPDAVVLYGVAAG
jgi:alpha-galactosidase